MTTPQVEYKLSDRDTREVLIRVSDTARWEHYGYYPTPRAAAQACEHLSAPLPMPLLDSETVTRYDLDAQYVYDDPYLLNNAGSVE